MRPGGRPPVWSAASCLRIRCCALAIDSPFFFSSFCRTVNLYSRAFFGADVPSTWGTTQILFSRNWAFARFGISGFCKISNGRKGTGDKAFSLDRFREASLAYSNGYCRLSTTVIGITAKARDATADVRLIASQTTKAGFQLYGW